MNTTFRRDPRDDATPSNRGRGTVHVFLDLLERVARHLHKGLLHPIIISEIFAHHQANVRRLALVGIVQARPLHEEPRVRQRVAHALRARAAQERAHARRQS